MKVKLLIVAAMLMTTKVFAAPYVIEIVPEHAVPGWRKQDSQKFVRWYRRLVHVAESRYHDNFRGNETRFKCAYWSGATPEQALRLFYSDRLPGCEQ